MKKKAIIVGFGGMGQRYYKALKKIDVEVIGICDFKTEKIKKIIKEKNIIVAKDYKKLLKQNADIVCIVTNTDNRFKIISDFLKKSKIKKILTEKPLAISYKKSVQIFNLAKKKKKHVLVNTYRTISPNYLKVKDFFKKIREEITHITINSPCAGLGNMGSVFFDLANFFLHKKAKSIRGWIDKTKTLNPRGAQFKDPGGYGIINYENNRKVFFDMSENTGLPYKIILKSKNYEFIIDEINNNYYYEKRPKQLNEKPIYYYIFKPEKKKMKLIHKYDTVLMTTYSLKKILNNSRVINYQNIKDAMHVMEIIIGIHISSKLKKEIKIPISKKFHNFSVNFA